MFTVGLRCHIYTTVFIQQFGLLFIHFYFSCHAISEYALSEKEMFSLYQTNTVVTKTLSEISFWNYVDNSYKPFLNKVQHKRGM